MKFIFSFIIATVFSVFVFSQNCKLKEVRDVNPDTREVYSKTLYNYNQEGKLESWQSTGEYVVSCTAEYSPFDGEFMNYKEGSDGFIHFTHWYKYVNGKISEILHHNDFDVCSGITRFEYDSEGRMKKITELDTQFLDTVTTSEVTYFYPNKSAKLPVGKLEVLDYNTDSLKLSYDDKMNPYFISMAMLGDWEQNNLLSQEVVDEKGIVNPELSLKYQYTYNKNNLPEKLIVTDGEGNFQFAQEFIYDCK